jgi:peptidoglycan/xylan/chitin deacetylase (PgdA/CDA1 family)
LASITFDDGFKTVAEVGLPYLASLRIPFTAFVNRMAIQDNRLWVSDVLLGRHDAEYMKRIHEKCGGSGRISFAEFQTDPIAYLLVRGDCRGLENPAAQLNRIYMNEDEVKTLHRSGVEIGSHTTSHNVMKSCDEQTLNSEIEQNRVYLAGLLGSSVTHFAFPFGLYDSVSLKAARNSHPFVHSTHRLCFRFGDISQPKFVVPRIILRNDSLREIQVSLNLAPLARQDPQFES